MINWLKGLVSGRTAIEKNRRNPVLQSVVQRSAEIYEQIPLRNFIDDGERESLARDLYLEINRICNAADPNAMCREGLAATMLKFAQYQVLVIPPEPEEDKSGLRGQPGITGNLKQHLPDLSSRAENLRADLFGTTDELSSDTVWSNVQTNYWKTYWLLETINSARIEMGDHRSVGDWYRPFMHAACASAEHVYRHTLELSPAFEQEVARSAATAYSIYTDIVVSGAEDPDGEWRDYHRNANIPVPHFDDTTP